MTTAGPRFAEGANPAGGRAERVLLRKISYYAAEVGGSATSLGPYGPLSREQPLPPGAERPAEVLMAREYRVVSWLSRKRGLLARFGDRL